MWTLRTFGGITFVEETGREIRIRSQKASAILGYLYLNPQKTVSRERICGLLWGESSEATARGALRQCLRRLSTDLAEQQADLVDIGRETLSATAEVVIDLQQLIESIGKAEADVWVPAAEEILHGFDNLDSQFTAWVRVFRDTWANKVSDALNGALSNPNLRTEAQTQIARVLFELEPTHEGAARKIINESLRSGNLGGALKIYQTLWDALDADWGEEPSADLQAQIVSAKQQGDARSEHASKEQETGPVIAIPPFQQAGPWNRPPYLINGFRKELIAALIRFREWVIVDDIAYEGDGIDYSISGGYGNVGETIAITITMIEHSTRRYIISENIEIETENWGESLRKIIRKTAIALNIHLSRNRIASNVNDSASHSAAYGLWLQANEARNIWREDTFAEAERLFEEVIAIDPNYAPGFSALAGLRSTRHLSEPGIIRRSGWASEAQMLAEKSVALDPLDARNHHALAWAHAMQGRYSQAEFHFELCVELNPNSPRTLVPCAHGFSFLGLHDNARRLTDQALEIHPFMSKLHWGYVMCIRYLSGGYDEAAQAGKQAGDAILDFIAWHAASVAMSGDLAAADILMTEFVAGARERWKGKNAPTDENIGQWLMQAFPIRKIEDLERLSLGFQKAGLRV